LRKILTKAKKGRGLTHREALLLLLCEDAEINALFLPWLKQSRKKFMGSGLYFLLLYIYPIIA
jgi:hypothetical protein